MILIFTHVGPPKLAGSPHFPAESPPFPATGHDSTLDPSMTTDHALENSSVFNWLSWIIMDYHGWSSFLSWIIIMFIMDDHHFYHGLSSFLYMFIIYYHHVPHVFPIFVAIEGGQKPSPSIRCLRGTQIMRVFSWILEQTSSEPEEKWSPEGQNIAIPWRIHGAAIYGAPWIPSIYPSHVSIFLPAPWILWVCRTRKYGQFKWISLVEFQWFNVTLKQNKSNILWMGQRNPAPPWVVETPYILGCLPSINWWFGFRRPTHSITNNIGISPRN